MNCIVVVIKAGGIWESELPWVYRKKTFAEKAFKATEDSLMTQKKVGSWNIGACRIKFEFTSRQTEILRNVRQRPNEWLRNPS